MATIREQRDTTSIGQAPLKASHFPGWWPVIRWVVLLALGALALPLYEAILQVAGTFLPQPEALFWPLLGVTVLYAAACWLVLRSMPTAGALARGIELALILGLGLAAAAVFWGPPPALVP